MRRFKLAAATSVVLTIGLVSGPAAQAQGGGANGLRIQESKSRVKVTGPGFVLRLSKGGLDVRINEDEFGDPSTGNPIVRRTINLGQTLRPFECRNGTYTITAGTFKQTFRVSQFARRPPPYTAGFATAFPGILTPFVGEVDATVTNAQGETLRVLVSDLAHEELTTRGFRSTAPIHGLFVDQQGRVRDRISLVGRFRSGVNGEHAVYGIRDRGTCRQIADLPFGPGSERAVVTGPFFVLPFAAPVRGPGQRD